MVLRLHMAVMSASRRSVPRIKMKTKKTLDTGWGMSRIAITLVIGALALGHACANNRTVEQQIDDAGLTASIGTKFVLDTEIDRYRIDIDTLNGIVTLRGAVSNAEQRIEAERIARGTAGVRDVVNELEIDATPRTASQAFDDAWIMTMIDSKLSVDPEVKSREVDVDVRDGVVTLSGIVDSAQARAEAEDLARSVDGVTQVVNELQVSG
jgi:hyperosmotically inducible protein